MHDSEAVRVDVGQRTSRFVVCPDCAARYRTPGPVVFDLTKMSGSEEHDHPVVRRVANHAAAVCEARSEPDGPVQLRDADVRRLAVDLRRTPQRLVELLREHQMLI